MNTNNKFSMNDLLRRARGEPAPAQPAKPTIPPGNAGNGANQPARPLTMNDLLRRAAGLSFWRR